MEVMNPLFSQMWLLFPVLVQIAGEVLVIVSINAVVRAGDGIWYMVTKFR